MSSVGVELRKQTATDLIEQILSKQVARAKQLTSSGWGAYRWFWYIRRLPDVFFDVSGDVGSTAPYDRTLMEVLVASGTDSRHIDGKLNQKVGTFSIDKSSARRIAHLLGFTKVVSQYQRAYRICGKGGSIRIFENDPFQKIDLDPDTRKAVSIYDSCRLHHLGSRVSSDRLGTAEFFPFTEVSEEDLGKTVFTLVPLAEPVPIRLGESGFTKIKGFAPQDSEEVHVETRYLIVPHSLVKVAKTMARVDADGKSEWNREIALLICMLNMSVFLLNELGEEGKERNFNLYRQGYIFVGFDEFILLWDNLGDWLKRNCVSHLGRLGDHFPSSGEELLDELLKIKGTPWPLCAGPVAYSASNKDGINTFDDRIALDLLNASLRLIDLLEFPSKAGEIANFRATGFEKSTQEIISFSSWSSSHASQLNNRHLRLDERFIGEIDAIAAKGDVLLVVSCKSIVYTGAYDKGDHNVVRNVAERISSAVERWDYFLHDLESNPVGDNYDLSAYSKVVGVVVTPVRFYVPLEIAEREALPGLPSYCSLSELEEWLNIDTSSTYWREESD